MTVHLRGCDSCVEPIDDVALPRHPFHDFTDADLATIARLDAEAKGRTEAAVLADLLAQSRRERQRRARRTTIRRKKP